MFLASAHHSPSTPLHSTAWCGENPKLSGILLHSVKKEKHGLNLMICFIRGLPKGLVSASWLMLHMDIIGSLVSDQGALSIPSCGSIQRDYFTAGSHQGAEEITRYRKEGGKLTWLGNFMVKSRKRFRYSPKSLARLISQGFALNGDSKDQDIWLFYCSCCFNFLRPYFFRAVLVKYILLFYKLISWCWLFPYYVEAFYLMQSELCSLFFSVLLGSY